MGCGMSGIDSRAPARRVRPTPIEFYDDENPPPPPPPLPIKEQLLQDVYNILQGLNQVKVPPNLVPVVCLCEAAIPLVLGDFKIDDQASSKIILPVIAISRAYQGHVVFMGSIDFLSHQIFESTETSVLMENLITWSSNYRMNKVRILAAGFPAPLSTSISSDFTSCGYIVEVTQELTKNKNVDIVFFPSSFLVPGLKEWLLEFLNLGVTVVCCADRLENYPDGPTRYVVNEILEDSGLAFSLNTLISSSTMVPSKDINKLIEYTFENTINNYLNILDPPKSEEKEDNEKLNSEEEDKKNDSEIFENDPQPEVTEEKREDVATPEIIKLDDAVSQLRYYVAEMTHHNEEDAYRIYQKSFEYLERINYKTDFGICPKVEHGIIALIITEILSKINPEKVTVSPLAKDFPGLPGKIQLTTQALKLMLQPNQWGTIHLYLPPGVVGTISSNVDLTMQIGSHTVCMLLKPGPWQRWPIITTQLELKANELTKFASPFGGILYLISPVRVTATIKVSNVANYPIYAVDKPQLFQKTSEIQIPWGEIRTKTIILTVPRKEMLYIENMAGFTDTIDKLVNIVYSFIGAKMHDFSRVIFDIELPLREPIIQDAVFMSIDSLDGIMNYSEGTSDMFVMLTYICLLLIPDAFYDREIELTMAHVAASYAMHKTYPDIPQIAYLPNAPSKLFNDLCDLYHEYGDEPFSTAMQMIMVNQKITNTQEAWTMFVDVLSKKINKKLPQLSDRFGHNGELSMNSSSQLQLYQLDDDDI